MLDNGYTTMRAFWAGALIRAGIALLLAPQTGAELRGMLRNYGARARDEAYERGREGWDTAVERGKDYVERGKETMREAGRTAREYVGRGKEAVKEAGTGLESRPPSEDSRGGFRVACSVQAASPTATPPSPTRSIMAKRHSGEETL